MIGFELTYYRLLTGEYSGDSFLINRAYKYWTERIQSYKEAIEMLPATDPLRLEVEVEYNMVAKVLAETKRNKKEMTIK